VENPEASIQLFWALTGKVLMYCTSFLLPGMVVSLTEVNPLLSADLTLNFYSTIYTAETQDKISGRQLSIRKRQLRRLSLYYSICTGLPMTGSLKVFLEGSGVLNR
jgi:hypothetical protein